MVTIKTYILCRLDKFSVNQTDCSQFAVMMMAKGGSYISMVKKVYAVYRGKVPKEIIQLFKLDSLFTGDLPPAVVKVRARMVGERLLPLLSQKVFDLMALEIKPEIEVVVGEMD